MRSTRSMRSTLPILISTGACLLSLSAHAQVSKCMDADGGILYSDRACGRATLIGYLDTDGQSGPIEKTTPVAALPGSIDRMPIRETAWATTPPTRRGPSTDMRTIGEARAAVADMDRGLAAIRSSRMVSSR